MFARNTVLNLIHRSPIENFIRVIYKKNVTLLLIKRKHFINNVIYFTETNVRGYSLEKF